MDKVTVRIGFVPSYRFGFSSWCEKMRNDSLAVFASVEGMEVVVPQSAPDGVGLDPEKGYTPHGAGRTWIRQKSWQNIFHARR